MTAEQITTLRQILDSSQNLVFFTGAGISVPSGIPDFRSADGLYMQKEFEGATPEEIISHTYFYKHPATFYRFYREKMLYPDPPAYSEGSDTVGPAVQRLCPLLLCPFCEYTA